MMWILLVWLQLCLCALCGALLCSIPFRSLITPSMKRRKLVLHSAANAVWMLMLAGALYFWGAQAAFACLQYGMILFLTVHTWINILVLPEKWREQIFISGVVVVIHSLLLEVPNYLVTWIRIDSQNVHLSVVLGIHCLVLLMTFWPLRLLLCGTVEPFLHQNNREIWHTMWFIPIVFFGSKFLSLGDAHEPGSILLLISSLLYLILIVLTCLSARSAQEKMHKWRIMMQRLEDQHLYYTELQIKVEEARKARHDLKHNIAAIRHYLELDDMDGLHAYCDTLVERSNEQVRIPYTGNLAADGVLYRYMCLAAKEHVDFQFSGVIHCDSVADMDLCALLGNALENALEACMTIDTGRSMSVVSQSEEQILSVMVRNTFDGKVIRDGKQILSRKREFGPGIGLSSMRSICERYGGSLELKWDDHNFTLMFMLPLTRQQS